MVWILLLSGTDLSTHALTPEVKLLCIRSLSRLDRRWSPRILSVALPLSLCFEAAPKCISGSTSYLQVWLAFHPHPQLIRKLFNAYRFGPPFRVTGTSTWSRVDHLVSRLPQRTKTPCSDSLSLRIRISRYLTLLVTVTRRFIMQKARCHTIKVLQPLVGAWFQELFHSSIRSAFHLSLTVLVHYRSLGSI